MADGRVPLDLTHVVYDGTSLTSAVLALLTLSPILLMPAYAALALQTRELTIINMWAGQVVSEALNLILKRVFAEKRPPESRLRLSGYGFPSSHSQYMGYFGSFLLCHLYFRHRFTSTGSLLLDQAFRVVVYVAILAWVAVVAYSRLDLLYHTPRQVVWGLVIGVCLGATHYLATELLPYKRPRSTFGRVRTTVVTHPIVAWMRIRDGWTIWPDGGREEEWKRWKTRYDERQARLNQRRR